MNHLSANYLNKALKDKIINLTSEKAVETGINQIELWLAHI
ncbi:hypothetical protein [Maribacter sp.]|nr:hypothetical protein [Maribacter sp.]